jgi:serine/threonine-protein kinase
VKDEHKTEAGGFSLRTIGLIVGGAGVVGLGAGTFFAVKAKGLDSDSNANGHCDETGCDREGMQLRNDALDAGNVATVLFVAGFALVGGGSAMYFLGDDGSAEKNRATPLSVTPRVGLSEAGIVVSGAL